MVLWMVSCQDRTLSPRLSPKSKVITSIPKTQFPPVVLFETSAHRHLSTFSHLSGVAGVINVATDSTFSNNISEIVSNTVTMTKEVVKSVQRAGGVKSFVLTSSRVAAFGVNGTHQEIDDTNWFDEAATLAEQAPEGGMKGALAYAASKVAGERALWKWVETEKVSALLILSCMSSAPSDVVFPFLLRSARVQR